MTVTNRSPKVSILILTYNAPKYVYKTLKSLQLTSYDNYEIIVLDNGSRLFTKIINTYALSKKWISKLVFLPKNILFSPGNNEAFKNISDDSKYTLLLNSDVEIKDSNWLNKLIGIHEFGATAYGMCINKPIRADGYCFLVDTELYRKYKLDEEFEWWWGLTRFQAEILEKENCKIKVVKNHDHILVHFGGASRKGFFNTKDLQSAKGLDLAVEEVKSWFSKTEIEIIDSL
ncbi:glycosyltransferase [Parapedobacter sp. SGR-10]|uniref:glycosyltransferase family 2 protein n=1 Tax=Parapedobacter sp. SGR-10 TaxID=2710879 RepID=UPI0013CFDF57|nr:glycosyltransferase [Parapedobacter sp. SGR-10]NGF56545.1 glycosyltransferase [Parapedobacter sp. SGR-10]